MIGPVQLGRPEVFGIGYLQERLDHEFPLVPHMGVAVASADERGVVLCAPFAPNANDKGTAFGGSLFSLAVLAGWAFTARFLVARSLDGDALIQESTIRYLAPARGALRAVLEAPATEATDRFCRMLERAGRGRLRLQVGVFDGNTLAARFEGWYVAQIR